MNATTKGLEFLSAEKKPWEMNGKSGESWKIKAIDGDEIVFLKAKGDEFTEKDFAEFERMTPVTCEVDVQTYNGKTSIYLKSIRKAGSPAVAKAA